jgi:P4 family phage/plasmid primase-like protien
MAGIGEDVCAKLHPDLKARTNFCIRLDKKPFVKHERAKNAFSPNGWTEPGRWLTFDTAVAQVAYKSKVWDAQTKQKVPCTGIGWICGRLGDGLQILGGDLDCCRDPETGLLSPWAMSFLQRVKPFYCEVSPSKCGIRFFSWGRLPDKRDSVFGNGPQDDLPEETKARIIALKPKAAEKIAKGEPAFNGVELYESGRHLSITGERLDDLCFAKENVTDTISQVLAPFLVAEPRKMAPGKTPKHDKPGLPSLDIRAVIDTSDFTMEGGQLFGPHPTLGSANGRNLVVNPSKNVYCWMHDGINAGGDPWTWLACEAGAVPWEQAGSGALSDARAMKLTLEHAVKRGLVAAEEVGLKSKAKDDDLTQDDVLDIEQPTNKDGKPHGEPKESFNHSKATDAILKKLPVALGEDDLLYYWHGRTWQPNAESVVFNKVRALAGNEFNLREQKEIIVALKHALTFTRIKFDPSPELMGLTNGTLNCKTSEFREYRREDLITDPVPVAFDPEARCPEILKFIEGVTPNYDDRITLLDIIASGAYRKALAYIAFLLGGGSSGSTKIIELIQAFYGAKTTEAVPLNELAEKQFALASLKNARYSIGQEIEDVKKAGTARIKEISGGDWISADVKQVQDRARFRGWTKLIFKGNSIPRFTDSTWGFKRRFVEVPLPYKFVPKVDPDEPDQRLADPDILDKIATPTELSGLLNVLVVRLPWIIKNGQIYRRSGQHDAYKRQVDSVTTFLEEFCTYYSDALGVRVPIKELHEHFEKWCNLIRGNLVERRQFGGYVKRYCNNRPGLETTINGRTETTYPGLTFDRVKFDKEIGKLQSQLKPDKDRIDIGSNTGLKSSQQIQNTGYTGLKSIVSPIENISAKELWNEITTFFSSTGVTRPLCSGVPVFDIRNHDDGDHPIQSNPVPSKKQTPVGINPNPINPVPITATASKQASPPDLDVKVANPAPQPSGIGPHPRRDAPTPPTKKKAAVCAKCGEDLTGKGQVEKSGKVYCAQVGCGYDDMRKA